MPGIRGPKPRLFSASDDSDTGTSVRPWKLSVQEMILASPSGTPFTSYAQRRAALMAVSTASAPVFIGSTAALPVRAATFS